MMLVAGGALLPDLDTPTATLARAWGPISGLAAAGVGALAGGHRWGTHDLVLAPVIVFALAAGGSLSTVGAGMVAAVAAGLIVAALGSIGRGRPGWIANLGVSTAAGWWHAELAAEALAMIPAAVTIGVLVHILGDLVTPGGVPVPVVWLHRRRRIAVPILRTGGFLERAVLAPTLCLVAGWLVLHDTGMGAVVRDQVEALPGVGR